MNIEEAKEYMIQSGVLGSILGLERMQCLCDSLGNPEDDLDFVHVAGTNGKGSTVAFISSILKAAGIKTGMYYSPALCGIKDHFMIDGCLISDEEYAELVGELKEADSKVLEKIGSNATQFELETALAFMYFSRNKCQAVVLETGLGGLTDATNIVKNKLACVFTSISYDHMAILGNSLSEIAGVKSGIITSDCPIIAFDSGDEVIAAISDKCKETGSELTVVSTCDKDYFDKLGVTLSLKGSYQNDNAKLAVETIKKLCKLNVSEEAIKIGLETAKWPFRYEQISLSPLIYLDGAHNPDAARRLKESVENDFRNRKIIFVIGMFKDKEYEKVISTLTPLANSVYTLTTPDNPRALEGAVIGEIARRDCSSVTVCQLVKEAALGAINEARENSDAVVIAFGSLSYLNDFKEAVVDILANG